MGKDDSIQIVEHVVELSAAEPAIQYPERSKVLAQTRLKSDARTPHENDPARRGKLRAIRRFERQNRVLKKGRVRGSPGDKIVQPNPRPQREEDQAQPRPPRDSLAHHALPWSASAPANPESNSQDGTRFPRHAQNSVHPARITRPSSLPIAAKLD